MLNFLKNLFKTPEPAGPPQVIKQFNVSDKPISEDVSCEGDCWSATGSQTFRLFEVAEPEVEQCQLSYKAKVKTESVTGRAYLEMWCRMPGRGEFFSKGYHHALKGSNDWASCEAPFYLKKGQRPDLVKLNIVIDKGGTVWIKDVELSFTPLK